MSWLSEVVKACAGAKTWCRHEMVGRGGADLSGWFDVVEV